MCTSADLDPAQPYTCAVHAPLLSRSNSEGTAWLNAATPMDIPMIRNI